MSAESTRLIKAALRQRFPQCKFKVAHGGERIEWTDDGPPQVEVEDAIIATGMVEIEPAWNDRRYLRLPDARNNIWFYRYNVAERAADERRSAEWRRQAQEDEAALAKARDDKRQAIRALGDRLEQSFDDAKLQTANDAFEALSRRAEAAVAIGGDDSERQRRPSFAPPLILDGELLELCRELHYLAADDPPIARMWASFADSKERGAILRETVSTLPLAGLDCRGFRLFAGSERGNVSDILFEAQRQQDGDWRFGPRPLNWESAADYFQPSREWDDANRNLVTAQRGLQRYGDPSVEARIAALRQRIADIDAKELAAAAERAKRLERRNRVCQLARERVLEFVGAADAQMRLAARLSGHCYICFAALIDPQSLERGIGPVCYAKRVDFIRANRSRPIEILMLLTGMPRRFVTEVIVEGAR